MVAVMSQWCQGAAIVTRGAGSRAKAAGLGPCSVRPGEAWREQRLSCFSSSMPIMSKGTEEAPNSGEPGESTVSLHAAPRCRAQGCWGSACGWEGRKGRAEATQCCGQAGSSRFLARGHSLGCGCPLTLLGLQGLLPFHPAVIRVGIKRGFRRITGNFYVGFFRLPIIFRLIVSIGAF